MLYMFLLYCIYILFSLFCILLFICYLILPKFIVVLMYILNIHYHVLVCVNIHSDIYIYIIFVRLTHFEYNVLFNPFFHSLHLFYSITPVYTIQFSRQCFWILLTKGIILQMKLNIDDKNALHPQFIIIVIYFI